MKTSFKRYSRGRLSRPTRPFKSLDPLAQETDRLDALVLVFLLGDLGRRGKVDLSHAVIDSASVRAVHGGHHTGPNPTDRAKRGCKRHLITDSNGTPLTVKTTAANVPDGALAIELLDSTARSPRSLPATSPVRIRSWIRGDPNGCCKRTWSYRAEREVSRARSPGSADARARPAAGRRRSVSEKKARLPTGRSNRTRPPLARGSLK